MHQMEQTVWRARVNMLLQEMVLESVRMERVHGWRAGLIPFAKDLDDTFLVSSDFGWLVGCAEWWLLSETSRRLGNAL